LIVKYILGRKWKFRKIIKLVKNRVWRKWFFLHTPWLWYCGVYSQNSEIYINILKFCKTNITCNVACFPRTWRHKKFHLIVKIHSGPKMKIEENNKTSVTEIIFFFKKYGKMIRGKWRHVRGKQATLQVIFVLQSLNMLI
jgi:hypothetical protein